MNFSWKKLIVPTITGVILTGCASTTKMVKRKPAVLMSSRGVVPQPYAEPVEHSEPLTEIGGLAAPVILDPIEFPPAVIEAPVKVTPSVKPAISSEVYTVVKGNSLSRIASKYTGFSYFTLAEVNGLDVNEPLKIGSKLNIPANGKRKQKQVSKSTPKKKKTTFAKKKSTSKKKAKQSIPSNGKYTVKNGDSLWLVAYRFGLSVKEVKSLNNLKNDRIHPGNVLILKEGNSAPVSKRVIKKVTPIKPIVPIKAVKKTTKPVKLTPITVTPAKEEVKVLEVPSNIYVDKHTVRGPNETLKTIAEIYGIKEAVIKAQNKGVNFKKLKPGQLIGIPYKL